MTKVPRRCIRAGCRRIALADSNYCGAHRPEAGDGAWSKKGAKSPGGTRRGLRKATRKKAAKKKAGRKRTSRKSR